MPVSGESHFGIMMDRISDHGEAGDETTLRPGKQMNAVD